MALVILSGKARCGKDTLGKILQDKFKENYFIMAYADALKRKCREDFNLSREQLYGDLKEVEDERYPRSNGSCWTPREILQHMGTEAYRAVENGFWIRQLFKYIDRNKLENVIITDGRFPDEIKAVKDRGGIHIRMERDHGLEVHGTSHASETSLDSVTGADYTVNNNGTIDDLEIIANKIIKEIER